MQTPMEKRYQEMHKGHLTFLQEGEEKHLTPDLIRAATLTGEAGEIRDKKRQKEAAGVTNIGLNVCGTDGRQLIREFVYELSGRL